MTFVATTLSILSVISSVLSIQINIYSNQIVSINKWEGTGNNLLGLSAYGGLGYVKDSTSRKKLVNDLGVNTFGYGQTLSSGLLPSDTAQANSCCKWKNWLSNYISSGKACETFSKTYTANIWGSAEYKAQGIESMIYLKDNCVATNQPTRSHCFSTNDKGGTPRNDDGWWTQMMVAFVQCTLQKDPKMKYFHIWNEPNAQFWLDGKGGDYYVDFYFTVAKAIKAKFPKIYIAGPVTWCPPIHWKEWEEYFTPLIDKMVASNRRDLLNYIDFHAYTTWDSKNNKVENNYARWDHVLNSINSVTGYYYGKTNGGWIRSLITETNVHVSDAKNANKYWQERVIENAKQIMALSFNRDKIELRHHFDLGATIGDLHFWGSGHTDEHMQNVLKPINNGYPIQFQFDWVKQGFPRFDNGNCIMTQSVWKKAAKTLTVLIINYCNANKWIAIQDKNDKIAWSKTARFTRRWGPNTQSVGVSGSKATTTLKPLSITAVTGTYKSNPSWYTSEIEFLPLDESVLMQILGRDDNPSITVNVRVTGLASNWVTRYAYIKFGFFKALMHDFKWTIRVKIGSTTYYTKYNFIPTMEYNELRIRSWSFYNKIKNGLTVSIQLIGTRISSNYKWNGVPGRFVFASLIAGNGNVELAQSFTAESNTAESDTITIASIIAISLILIVACIVIFVTFYYIKRRKMKNAVSFEQSKLDQNDEEEEVDGDGAYDMSPIDVTNDGVTNGDEEESEEKEKEKEKEDENNNNNDNTDGDEEVEIDFEIEEDQ